MSKLITPKTKRIIKAKIKGASNKDIGAVEYPNATPRSQEVMVSRELKKPNVAQYYEQSKLQALKEHNITWSRIIKPISDGLAAQTNIYDKQGILMATEPDLNTQMRASKQAADLLRIKDEVDPDAAPLNNLPADFDEVQLIRMLKSK